MHGSDRFGLLTYLCCFCNGTGENVAQSTKSGSAIFPLVKKARIRWIPSKIRFTTDSGNMTDSQIVFPLSGVIGIVDSSRSQLDLAQNFGLNCVEIRADLLGSTAGMSNTEVLSVVNATKDAGLACLYTLRHANQGGTYNGSENERVALCKQALEAGADIIDLEFDTESAIAMSKSSAPMILSYHNFDSMLDDAELAKLSAAMEAQLPAAVKIIPTGQSLADAAVMMNWVGNAGASVKRIGFSMGSDGATGRVLALKCGSPITYASFGDPVAPGQVDMKLLLQRYKCMSMTANTRVTALIGDDASIEQFYAEQCTAAESDGKAAGQVGIAFSIANAKAVEQWQKELNISEIIYL